MVGSLVFGALTGQFPIEPWGKWQFPSGLYDIEAAGVRKAPWM